MSKIKLDRDIRVNGQLFEAGAEVDTIRNDVDYAEALKDIMKNTTKEQAEAVAHFEPKEEE
jgi:hypothetical protein